MYLHQALKNHLVSDSSVYSIMGDRFFYVVIPQRIASEDSRVPCVVYDRRNVERQVTYCGTSGLIQSLINLDVYAKTYTEARNLGGAVRNALLDFQGLLAGVVSVRAATLEGEFDLLDIEPGLFRVSQSWAIWHLEE